MANQISNLGLIPNEFLGGRTFTNLPAIPTTATMIHLVGSVETQQYTGLNYANGTTYPVTTAKTFTPLLIGISVGLISSGKGVKLAYGDSDIGFNAGAAPANPKYYGTNSSTVGSILLNLNVSGEYYASLNIFTTNAWTIPAGKFLFIDTQAAVSRTGFFVIGYEN